MDGIFYLQPEFRPYLSVYQGRTPQGKEVRVETALNLLKDVDIKAVEDISVIDDISVIAAVGEGLIHYEGIASEIFTAVAERGINVRLICFGASPVALYFIVKDTEKLEAVKAIHEYFFSPKKYSDSEQNKMAKSYQEDESL